MLEKYILIPADESVKPYYVEIDSERFNDTVHELLDCDYFEPVYCHIGYVLLVDEVGKLKDPPKPVNFRASGFYPGSMYGDPIVGDVIVCTEGMRDGEPDFVPLSLRLDHLMCRILEMN